MFAYIPGAPAGSIFRVLKELKAKGYDVGPMPSNEKDLIESILHNKEAKFNSSDLNIAYRMKVCSWPGMRQSEQYAVPRLLTCASTWNVMAPCGMRLTAASVRQDGSVHDPCRRWRPRLCDIDAVGLSCVGCKQQLNNNRQLSWCRGWMCAKASCVTVQPTAAASCCPILLTFSFFPFFFLLLHTGG